MKRKHVAENPEPKDAEIIEIGSSTEISDNSAEEVQKETDQDNAETERKGKRQKIERKSRRASYRNSKHTNNDDVYIKTEDEKDDSKNTPTNSTDESYVEESSDSSSESHDDVCWLCDGVGTLLCCDSCSRSYHIRCIDPRPDASIETWICPHCVCNVVLFSRILYS